MGLAQLVNQLSQRVERPLEDRTGLTGMYAYDLRTVRSPGNTKYPRRTARIMRVMFPCSPGP